MSVLRPDPGHQGSDDESAPTGEDLTRNMIALDAGLTQIAQTFGEHVVLLYEDPVTFGAGHFVLYPFKTSTPRFAIEEQYTDTDWSDDGRVPTSWTWASEARLPQPDGSHAWVTLAEGEILSADYPQLLETAGEWAGAVQALAVREEAVSVDAFTVTVRHEPGADRTSLA